MIQTRPLKLFCFPFAGASANAYFSWQSLLEPEVQLVPVELPGRGRRFSTPLCRTMEPLCEDLYRLLKPELQEGLFAFFGHSMGSLVVFELTHFLSALGEPLPCHLFFSGRNAPHCRSGHFNLNSPDEELIDQLLALGGANPELFQEEELKALFVPIIRADLGVIDAYRPAPGRKPLDIPASLFYGVDDPLISPAGLQEWDQYTAAPSRHHRFPGAHMYLQQLGPAIVAEIKQTLRG